MLYLINQAIGKEMEGEFEKLTLIGREGKREREREIERERERERERENTSLKKERIK